MGKVYQKEKKLDLAIEELSEAIRFGKINGEDYPIVYDYHSNRGACYLKKNMYSQALEDFNYALKLNDSNANIYANKGVALYKLKKVKAACESWQRALELGQKSVQNYIDNKCRPK
ncbi:tetratricopeptide repeat protein [Ascidiimonas sp. W6]|uniref:tetratricopeptide repeat protein n=1 Tax=Ascidiimonas meishanensis TaxID=3128903 RepID=UPI0030EDD430